MGTNIITPLLLTVTVEQNVIEHRWMQHTTANQSKFTRVSGAGEAINKAIRTELDRLIRQLNHSHSVSILNYRQGKAFILLIENYLNKTEPVVFHCNNEMRQWLINYDSQTSRNPENRDLKPITITLDFDNEKIIVHP